MKELYNLGPRSRLRLIMSLFIVFTLLTLAGIAENRNLHKMNEDMHSIYADRLIPTAQLFGISEYLFENRLALWDLQAESGFSPERIWAQIETRNSQIDSLLEVYQRTYFVDEEHLFLNEFLRQRGQYLKKEIALKRYWQVGDYKTVRKTMQESMLAEFDQMVLQLTKLTSLQTRIGQQLLKNSELGFQRNTFLYYLRLAITLLIGIFILVIIRTSRHLVPQEKNFRMN